MTTRNIGRGIASAPLLAVTLFSRRPLCPLPQPMGVRMPKSCSPAAPVSPPGRRTGKASIDALTGQLPGKSVNLYPVNYPSTTDYVNSARAGAADAVAHVQGTAGNCPKTKIVLGGYSQGAAVMDLTSHQLSPQVANHVAAVALFGNPESSYSKQLSDSQIPALDPSYSPRRSTSAPPGHLLHGGREHPAASAVRSRIDRPGRDVRGAEALALLFAVGVFAGLNAFRLAWHFRVVGRIRQIAQAALVVGLGHRQQRRDRLVDRVDLAYGSSRPATRSGTVAMV